MPRYAALRRLRPALFPHRRAARTSGGRWLAPGYDRSSVAQKTNDRDVGFRLARAADALAVAALHADSWRRHYRGAYSDAFLDGDVLKDRRSVWEARLCAPGPYATIMAE